MKKKELKKLSDADLKARIEEMKKELMKLKSQVATGTIPENPGKIKALRKNIARILTFLKEKSENKTKGGR